MAPSGDDAKGSGSSEPLTAEEAARIEASQAQTAQEERISQLIREQMAAALAQLPFPMPTGAPVEETAIPQAHDSPGGGRSVDSGAVYFSPSEETHYPAWRSVLLQAAPGFEHTLPPEHVQQPQLYSVALDRVMDFLLSSPKHQAHVEEYYHALCFGAFTAGAAVEARSLLRAICSVVPVPPSFGYKLEGLVHSLEAIDGGMRFRLAYLRKYWETVMQGGDPFVLEVIRDRHLRPGTDSLGSSELTELLEQYKDRVYDANVNSAAKTSARLRFGGKPGVHPRPNRDRDGGGGGQPRPGARNRSPQRDAAGSDRPATRPPKDSAKDTGKGKEKADPPPAAVSK